MTNYWHAGTLLSALSFFVEFSPVLRSLYCPNCASSNTFFFGLFYSVYWSGWTSLPCRRTMSWPKDVYFNPFKLICFDAAHTACRKQCNLCCILKLLLIFHYWAEKEVQHKIEWTRERHPVLWISFTESQPPLCAGFWVFHHFADQLFDSDVVYCFSWEMNLTQLLWINNKRTKERLLCA